jgi:hypothetical protein
MIDNISKISVRISVYFPRTDITLAIYKLIFLQYTTQKERNH